MSKEDEPIYFIQPDQITRGNNEQKLFQTQEVLLQGETLPETRSVVGTLVFDDGDHRVVLPTRERKNSIILGKTGDGKSTGAGHSLTAHAIANGDSIIMADPKGEHIGHLGETLKKAGYQILRYDPYDSGSSDSLNIVRFISDRYHEGNQALALQMIDNLVSVLLPMDYQPRERSWIDASQKVLSAEILSVIKYDRHNCSFLTVLELHKTLFGNGAISETVLKSFERDNDIYGRLSHAITNANQTRGSIIAPIAGALSAMSSG